MGEEKIHETVQKRYSHGYPQNQATDVVPEKELQKDEKSHCTHYAKHTTEHVLNCGKDEDTKRRNIKDNTGEEWDEVVKIFRENKRKREERKRKFRKKEIIYVKGRRTDMKSVKEHTDNSTYSNKYTNYE